VLTAVGLASEAALYGLRSRVMQLTSEASLFLRLQKNRHT